MATYKLGGFVEDAAAIVRGSAAAPIENPCAKVEALRVKGITAASSAGIPAMAMMVSHLEQLCAQERANTPFAPVASGPTLNLRSGPVGSSPGGDPCAGLAARAKLYGAVDPQPAIRRALVEKCEAAQRSGVRAVDPNEATGYPEPSEGMDPKVKIAIGVGAALALGFVGWKVLG